MKTDEILVPAAKNFILTIEIATPLGPMIAGATAAGICILEFGNRIRLEQEIKTLKNLLHAEMIPDRNEHLDQLENELHQYFEGKLKIFTVKLHTPGNEFAQIVWKSLQEIPYGTTCSYKQQALRMKNPKAIRAIASTNGRNRLAIVIPCHRVIGSNGSMTGYAAGIEKKKWLLQFERDNSEKPADLLF
jgi:AraC family transcriptional regulator of adaptative response/methylated-DNA-[protein]-cysteine methyltransferase